MSFPAVIQPPECNGWRAVKKPDSEQDYDIYAPGCYNTFRGLARSFEVALQWLQDASGWTYSQLPAVKYSELRIEHGPKIPIAQFPYRKNEWYRHTHYYYGDKRLGSIQSRYRNKRSDSLTIADTGGCIIGSDLRWLLQQSGLRLTNA